MAECTKTPWRAPKGIEPETTIRGADNRPVCEVWLNGDDWRQNRALIINAVNNHEALVNVLRGFLADPKFVVSVGGNPLVVDAFLDEARRVLALSTTKEETPT